MNEQQTIYNPLNPDISLETFTHIRSRRTLAFSWSQIVRESTFQTTIETNACKNFTRSQCD